MTEFAILTIAMLPIMIGIPMVGKMIDLKQTTINASRYAAWEATVSTSPNSPAQIDSRFFQDAEGEIKTQAVQHASNRLWGETGAVAPTSFMEQGAVRISDNSSVSNVHTDITGNIHQGTEANAQTRSSDGGSSVGTSFGGIVKNAGEILSWAPGTDWGIAPDGLLRATVQVDVKKNDLLDGLEHACSAANSTAFACMTAANSIMVDNWSASSDHQAADRTRSFVPTTAIREVSDILAAIGNIPVFDELKGFERKGGNFGFGHVDMKAMPKLLDAYPE